MVYKVIMIDVYILVCLISYLFAGEHLKLETLIRIIWIEKEK